MNELKAITASVRGWIAPEYSTMSIWNQTETLMLLVAVDHFQLYRMPPDGQVQFLCDLPIAAHQEPKWSRRDPLLLYYVNGNVLTMAQFNAADERVFATSIEATFGNYVHHYGDWQNGVSGLGESDISEDGGHFVFTGMDKFGNQWVFVYSLAARVLVAPAWPMPDGTRSLYLTGSNEVLCGTLSGTYLFTAAGEPRGLVMVGPAPHMDVFHDSLIYCSSNDAALNKNAVAVVDVHDPASRRVLMDLAWPYAFHISCCDQPFCLVSIFDLTNTLPAELWKVPYAGQPTKLATIPTTVHDYTGQPKASLSRSGRLAAVSVEQGSQVNTWLLTMETPAGSAKIGKRIDYSSYVGRAYFIMRPRTDGAVDIEQVDLP